MITIEKNGQRIEVPPERELKRGATAADIAAFDAWLDAQLAPSASPTPPAEG